MPEPEADTRDTLRRRALAAIGQVRWVPASGEARITGMIENRPDWVVSRQRAWGVPIAVFVERGGDRILFLNEPGWAMFWAIFVSVWAHMGFYTLILLAGLQAIPSDLYEAAAMDRTPTHRIFWRITLPLLWPNMIVVIVLALIKGVQTFDEVFVLTGGGPGTATMMVVQYIYETAFANQVQNFGLAAAASVLLGAVLFILTLIQLGVAGRRRN